MKNFLPLAREIQNHWVYQDAEYFKTWIEMLFMARYGKEPKTDIYKGIKYTINYSEFLFSRTAFSKRIKISEQRLRTLMDYLIEESMITKIKSLGKNKPTIYSIVNYNLYNQPTFDQPSEPECNTVIEGNTNQVATNRNFELFSDWDFSNSNPTVNQPSEPECSTVIEGNTNLVTTKSQPSDNLVTTKSQPLKKKDNIEKKDNKYNSIFDYWNTKKTIVHRKSNQKMKKEIDKALKDYTIEEIKVSIGNYAEMIHSEYKYCGHKWGLDEFLQRAGGYTQFMDDGGKWIRYSDWKKNPNGNNKKSSDNKAVIKKYKEYKGEL